MKTTLNYFLAVGNTEDLAQFIQNGLHLPEPIRGEFMTIAEQLQAMGEELGEKQGESKRNKEIAVNLLKEGTEPAFVTRMTGLDMNMVLELKAKVDSGEL